MPLIPATPGRAGDGVSGCRTRLPRQLASYLSSSQTLVPSQLLDPLHPPYQSTTPKHSWRVLKRVTRRPHLCKSIPSGAFDALCCLPRRRLLNECSLQDALRSFFQPIKTGDPRLDFYTMYKREATEYDTDYVKKYDEDLNTTLIFVRPLSFPLVKYLTCSFRQVYFLPSAQLSSSTSIQTSNPIRMTNLQPFSVPSSSLSTSPPSPVRPPRFHLSRKARRARPSSSRVSCTRVF